MKKEKLFELMELPLRNRIVVYNKEKKDTTVDYILDYIEETKDKIDYIRLISAMSKSEFYNGHWIIGEDVIKEYSNCEGMLLFYDYKIHVISLYYLINANIEDIPTSSQITYLWKILRDKFKINIFEETIESYKTKLELYHRWSEAASYEWVDDIKFMNDKTARIKKLKKENCITYEDYNKIYGVKYTMD